MKTYIQLLLVLVCLGLFSTPLMADSVCDDELLDGNVNPGLYGLCVAYCEAQDCDSYGDDGRPSSCNRLISNYNRLKGDSGPDMPCDTDVECPCWSMDELSYGGGDLPASACWYDDPLINGNNIDLALYANASLTLQIGFTATPDGCAYRNDPAGINDFSPTTAAESAICHAGVQGLHVDFGGSGSCAVQN
jgi:hypothetical protein